MEARSLLSALPTDVIAFYRRAENYRRYTLADSGRVRALGTLVQREERSFGRSVLDLACGGGILGFVLESPGRRYLGVDVNPEVSDVARAAARARGATG
ncbi:MAG: hypothetical protein ACREDE_05585, partial [Thermoplasmata archaeon]